MQEIEIQIIAIMGSLRIINVKDEKGHSRFYITNIFDT